MSQTQPLRTQSLRAMSAAVERARLTVVPSRALGRTQAGRTPFAVLVIALLVSGVVGLLMFNTSMQQTSFAATALQDKADALTAQKQSLSLELDDLRQPQRVAEAAQRLGMVTPPQPAFLRLEDGRVLGVPAPATGSENLQINPAPVEKPAALVPEVVTVVVDPTTGKPVSGAAGSGAAGSGADSASGTGAASGARGD